MSYVAPLIHKLRRKTHFAPGSQLPSACLRALLAVDHGPCSLLSSTLRVRVWRTPFHLLAHCFEQQGKAQNPQIMFVCL